MTIRTARFDDMHSRELYQLKREQDFNKFQIQKSSGNEKLDAQDSGKYFKIGQSRNAR